MPSVLIVGVGHPDRGDDAVGLLVARRLKAARSLPLEIRECPGDVLSLLDAWHDRDAAVIVDAVAGGGPPGTVRVIDLLEEAPPPSSPSSNHGLGVAEVVALARALGRAPRALSLVGISGEEFGMGAPPTAAVSDAIPAAAAAASREALRLAAMLDAGSVS